jgi:hypothetical protein
LNEEMKMKKFIALLLSATVVAVATSGCGGAEPPTSIPEEPAPTPIPSTPTSAVEPIMTATPVTAALESPLLRLLRFVPDTPEYREYLTYGDAEAWHDSWNVPRLDNWDELENLGREPAAYWMFIMPRQTTPPESLGTQYLRTEDQRGFYGFDLFNLDRFISAGQPPNYVTAVEFSFDGTEIADALSAFGYEAEALDTGGTLYSILDDYEIDMESPTHAGKLGNLNRIALLDGQMVIAKATDIVIDALLAQSGEVPSLADSPEYAAAVAALEGPALGETGELVGVILVEGSNLAVASSYIPLGGPEEAVAQLREYAEGPQLPAYDLVAFATSHTEGASYLTLAVVFPQGTDAGSAADILAGRLQDYVSLRYQKPLDDRWTYQMATAVEIEGLPVALVVMGVGDPSPTPEDAPLVEAGVLSWIELVVARDTLFLVTELPSE